MKKLLAVAAIIAVPLAGCATTDGSSRAAPRAQAASSGTYFCWKERLSTSGDGYVCNWEGSKTDACTSSSITTTLARAALAGAPKDAGRCANGQWLVQVNTR